MIEIRTWLPPINLWSKPWQHEFDRVQGGQTVPLKEQHVSGLPIRWLKIHKPCTYCGEIMHTNVPGKEYHGTCARKRKTEQKKQRKLENQK